MCFVDKSPRYGGQNIMLYIEYFSTPKIAMLKPNPQCYNICKWVLWEVIGFRWGHEGKTP